MQDEPPNPVPADDAAPDAAPAPSLWRDRAFVAIWSASTVSIFGSLITRTALPWAAILTLDAGAMDIAALRGVEQVAGLLVGLFAGAWVDRLRRRPIMIGADLGRALLLGSIPVAFAVHALGMTQLIVVAFLAAMLSTVFDVADRSYLPSVVARRHLVRANSALTASASVAEFSSFGIGGFLINILTAPIAIAFDAISFVVSALLLGTIRKAEPPPKPVEHREPVLHEIREGLRIVAHSPTLRALALSHGGTHILWGIFGTGYLLYARDQLGLDPAATGIIAALGGVGSLAGSLAVPWALRRFGVGRTILGGMGLFTIGNFLIPLAPSGAPLLAAGFLITQQLIGDSGGTVYEIVETSVVQSSVHDRVLGRVNASIFAFTTGATLLGVILGGVIGEVLGLRTAFFIGMVGAVIAIAAVWFSPVRHMRDTTISDGPVMPGDQSPLTE
ncbi:MAG TPA: MFS transporter [Candidatus Limnocylindrales bacterium]|nr:MFS transporter [Candidatus Limnocylindrales bacterium]